MAQDFYAAFGTGVDNRHITSIDEDGVALAAIKALHAENAKLTARLATLEAKVAAMSQR
jgi:cell division protein FtsB